MINLAIAIKRKMGLWKIGRLAVTTSAGMLLDTASGVLKGPIQSCDHLPWDCKAQLVESNQPWGSIYKQQAKQHIKFNFCLQLASQTFTKISKLHVLKEVYKNSTLLKRTNHLKKLKLNGMDWKQHLQISQNSFLAAKYVVYIVMNSAKVSCRHAEGAAEQFSSCHCG